MFENRKGTGKGIIWVNNNFSRNRATSVITRSEDFLDNMNYAVIGKGCSGVVDREKGDVVLNENLEYQKTEWRASLYYIYLEYGLLLHRVFFPSS